MTKRCRESWESGAKHGETTPQDSETAFPRSASDEPRHRDRHWALAKHQGPPDGTVAPVMVESCWAVIGLRGHVLACAIYHHEHRVELRSCFGEEVMRSQYVRAIETARALAVEWRRALLESGIYTEAGSNTVTACRRRDGL
jgi:hypothetical protein